MVQEQMFFGKRYGNKMTSCSQKLGGMSRDDCTNSKIASNKNSISCAALRSQILLFFSGSLKHNTHTHMHTRWIYLREHMFALNLTRVILKSRWSFNDHVFDICGVPPPEIATRGLLEWKRNYGNVIGSESKAMAIVSLGTQAPRHSWRSSMKH